VNRRAEGWIAEDSWTVDEVVVAAGAVESARMDVASARSRATGTTVVLLRIGWNTTVLTPDAAAALADALAAEAVIARAGVT
jgi:hypothetical protein